MTYDEELRFSVSQCAQHDRFNRGIWARLEGYVRDWAEKKGTIYVITGAVFDRDGDGARVVKFTDSAVPLQ